MTVQYAPGRAADVFGDAAAPAVLMWHGMQTDSRAALRPLAELIAGRGFGVVVPDWNSHADDRGRADLLRSVEYACSWGTGSERLAVVGWSMGGAAAAGLTVHATHLGVEVSHTVCLAGAFMVADPISGQQLGPSLSAEHIGAPFTLLHGVNDDVVPITVSRTFAADLEHVGWPARLVELPADHATIAGARYDAAADRYAPAEDAETLQTAELVADHITAALSRSRRDRQVR
ncbi:esterase [Mycobacterium sp. GA-1841]|uniref:alpha/beta hydrolase family protein n=1 Tax=Mycobacterium sp. GA-1841 TaxID=1834154 RepID=UPI00096F6352|nr:dienelactone hydrolase family protein [Mycobacterium sp. GA-1841]OMC31171.1 esterase [Mycobacterium sp. GA-1841]